MQVDIIWWVAFNAFILVLLAIDLGVFHRTPHEISLREGLIWSVVWTVLALLFNVWIYYENRQAGLAFFTGYLIERSLSIDNIFVFYLIFSFFSVPKEYQHRVLFWGILGALLMRAFFIAVGVTLINRFHWVVYVFGAFLVITGIKMGLSKDVEIHPEKNPVLKLFNRWFRTTADYVNGHFFARVDGRLFATPLLVVLLIVETTDLIFAVDSIPAILAITTDPFIVYTSNVLAILGLRALYFALAGITAIRYIHYGLSVILVFVGVKMMIEFVYEIPILWSLAFIGAVLLVASVASAVHAHRSRSASE